MTPPPGATPLTGTDASVEMKHNHLAIWGEAAVVVARDLTLPSTACLCPCWDEGCQAEDVSAWLRPALDNERVRLMEGGDLVRNDDEGERCIACDDEGESDSGNYRESDGDAFTSGDHHPDGGGGSGGEDGASSGGGHAPPPKKKHKPVRNAHYRAIFH